MRRPEQQSTEYLADVVLSIVQTARMLDVHPGTLRRMTTLGIGPARIRISSRRVGFRLSKVREWLDTRDEAGGNGLPRVTP
jgi:predicted DNA-binding transcriptional regulator AlpA